MSRLAWVPAPRTSPELYEQIEVPEPGDPGYPSAELPGNDPRSVVMNEIRAEIDADYAGIGAGVDAIWDEPACPGDREPEAG